jgi:Family of unknown function (DUF5317)
VFVLYGVVGGLLMGLLFGGRPGRLAGIRFEWGGVILAGTLVQLVLFSDYVSPRIGELGPPVYVVSTALVLVALLRNVRIPGLVVVAAGAASNLAAILGNGGYMPVSSAALGPRAGVPFSGYSNSIELANPALGPLTDIFALPRWLPGANVFSVGDVLIVVGIALAIVLQMRTREVVHISDRMVRFGPMAQLDPSGPGVRPWTP